jgi:hypothetical protein
MLLRAGATIVAAIVYLAPTPSAAALRNYIQNFETLVAAEPTALSADGWVVYGNVFTPGMVYLYGYGPFPAPNGPAAFCAIDVGQGGEEQGLQQLSVYSDYNNLDHATGNLVESNVYRETSINASDVGSTWIFEFDAKRGNLAGTSTALAFIKTLNPAMGYATTNFFSVNTTAIDTIWSHHSISITIDASLPNQLLQIGFANTTTNYQASGIFYDNIVFHNAVSTSVETTWGQVAGRQPYASVAPNPLNPGGVLSFRTASAGPVSVTMFDHNGRLVRTLLERQRLPAGAHEVRIDSRDSGGRTLASGVYFYRVVTPEGVASGRFSILK